MNRHRVGPEVAQLVLLLFVLAVVTATAVAQVSTSAVRGTVIDPQGSVVANATVTITNIGTNQVRTQKTGQSGNFSFDLIQPGTYTVKVEAPGFKSLEKQVEALISRPSDMGSMQLQVGAQDQVVTVSAENQSVQINTQDSALGSNFVSEQITQLPVEARNVLSLLTLQAGVTKDGYVAGARSDQSNVTLDGVNDNDAQTNEITGNVNGSAVRVGATSGPVLRLNAEAIEEFRVNTVTSDASAGRSGGAQINLVTKSGSNNFHGSLFEFHRNTIFNANDWFNNHAGLPRETLLRNTFGAALGGYIKKNKLFFFYSYEGRRDAATKSVSTYGGARIIPTASLAQGNIQTKVCMPVRDPDTGDIVSCTPAGIRTLTPADIATIFPDLGGENPAALAALKIGTRFTPNTDSVGDGLNTGGYLFNAAAPVRLNAHVAKFDYNITQKQSVFVRLNVIYDHDGSSDVAYFPDRPAPTVWSHPWGIAVGHTWTIHNNLISNFKYGLTREAYTLTGDTQGSNYNYLRSVYYDTNGTYNSSRATPVHNFVEDISLVKGKHTIQFGGTVDLINNGSVRYGSAYDVAYANPSGYKTNLITDSLNNYLESTAGGLNVDPAVQSQIENVVTSVLGRYNNYTANFTFDHDGKLLTSGTPSVRHFATQGYEMYIQDSWKLKQNLTLTAGLRYSLWRPVYETNGYEAQPNIKLTDFFNQRVAGMNAGQPYNDLLTVNKSGPVNNGPPMYSWDKKVFLPKVAVAWSPRFENSLLRKMFGADKSVIRGGFAVSNDYFGPAIATFFDIRNTLGFNSAQVIPVSTFNVGCGQYVVNGFYGGDPSSCDSNPGPLFTGFGQEVRNLPLITPPTTLSFPQQKPAVKYPTAIESSLDAGLVTPKNYNWSLTFERELGHGGFVQFSYIGRSARHLLAQRDVMTPTNLRDPKSGMDWYTAATILEKARQNGVDPSYFVANPLPYFENLFPKLITAWGYNNATEAVYDDAFSYNANDWTTTMLDIDRYSITPVVAGQTYSHAFYQPQYGALATWTTIGYSNYNAFTASFRERIKGLTLDFNYTYSHSLDDASGQQSEAGYSGASLILNPFRPQDNYAASDFDMRHIINVSSVWELPVGKGKSFLSDSGRVVNGILGGWQISNIFRWNTGIPFGAPYDANTWSTNWENQSALTRIASISNSGCPSRNVPGPPKFFGNCMDSSFGAFRSSYPGETGERNTFRFPSYIVMDMGVGKTWKLFSEGRELQFRWETFNLTNTQRFGENLDWSRSGWGIIPGATTPTNNFSNFRQIQGSPRIMQFGLRFAF